MRIWCIITSCYQNFHKIHSELLDIFYSYLQTLTHKNIHLHYVFVTENISFIPDNILDRCKIITVKRPNKTAYKKSTGKLVDKTVDLSKIVNPHLTIDNVKLLIKEGGKSGLWTNPDGLPEFLKNIF